MWHDGVVTFRRLLSALIAAFVGLGSVPAAEAQLWKPKKKAATTAKKPAPKKQARKKPVRKKKNTSSVVKFGPPKDRGDDEESSSNRLGAEDRDEAEEAADFDDNPRISVYDGDRED